MRDRIRRFLVSLGPGLIAGAADDDPSGVGTYVLVGATLGYATLWTALWTLPLLVAVQLMCARIGLVSGGGLMAVLKPRYPRPVLYVVFLLLLVANLFNIAADLSGMSDAAAMLTTLPRWVFIVAFSTLTIVMTVHASYKTFARYVKWLALALVAYVFSAILAHPDWRAALRTTVVPPYRWDHVYVTSVLAVLGATISPYLFFWQASQEVEEERAHGRRTPAQRHGATTKELAVARVDVWTGMMASNLVMYFVILASASTLFRGGFHDITNARHAAEVLRPLAGAGASVLFGCGLIGVGLGQFRCWPDRLPLLLLNSSDGTGA